MSDFLHHSVSKYDENHSLMLLSVEGSCVQCQTLGCLWYCKEHRSTTLCGMVLGQFYSCSLLILVPVGSISVCSHVILVLAGMVLCNNRCWVVKDLSV